MQVASLDQMVKGWFIGNFEPSLLKTNDMEIGIKRYLKGDRELAHYHKIATEYTVVIQGKVMMNGVVYADNSIIIIKPGDSTDFEALENSITVVVKIPGANNDKYLSDPGSAHD